MIRRYCDASGCSIDDHKTYRKFSFGVHLPGDLRTRYVDANHNLASMVDSTYTRFTIIVPQNNGACSK